MELEAKSFSSKLIPLKQVENDLITKYTKLMAEFKVEYKGKNMGISELSIYTRSKDRDVRKESIKIRNMGLMKIRKEFDDIYDKLVNNRQKQAEAMGYENFVELGYYKVGRDFDNKRDVKKFRDGVKKYLVPLADKMNNERRKRLGLDELTFIDEGVFFKEGNPKPIGKAEDIFLAGRKMYSELSKETKEFFDFMLEHELFDVLPRENKVFCGYMEMIKEYKAPFIYAVFNGTDADVQVITHECGHAFQAYLTRNYEIQEFNDITAQIAEVHSMSMEFFTSKWMELFFGDRADDYRTMQLENSLYTISYACMVDEFQEIIYSNPYITPKERNDVWNELEKQYRPHITSCDDEFYDEGRIWQLNGHIYSVPFYYIEYAIAEACALQFKEKMDINFDNAWKMYVKFCLESAKGEFIEMLEEAGLKNPFNEQTIKEIAEKLK